MQITVLAFEEPYDDDSGTEYGVRYDNKNEDQEIEFEHVGTLNFPAHRIDWLIDALSRIRNEIDAATEER